MNNHDPCILIFDKSLPISFANEYNAFLASDIDQIPIELSPDIVIINDAVFEPIDSSLFEKFAFKRSADIVIHVDPLKERHDILETDCCTIIHLPHHKFCNGEFDCDNSNCGGTIGQLHHLQCQSFQNPSSFLRWI